MVLVVSPQFDFDFDLLISLKVLRLIIIHTKLQL